MAKHFCAGHSQLSWEIQDFSLLVTIIFQWTSSQMYHVPTFQLEKRYNRTDRSGAPRHNLNMSRNPSSRQHRPHKTNLLRTSVTHHMICSSPGRIPYTTMKRYYRGPDSSLLWGGITRHDRHGYNDLHHLLNSHGSFTFFVTSVLNSWSPTHQLHTLSPNTFALNSHSLT